MKMIRRDRRRSSLGPGGSEKVEEALDRSGHDPAGVIAVMQDLQAAFGYLPEGELRYVAERLGIPLCRVYHLATFYKAFRLVPRGRHGIRLCAGTACHVRGAPVIKDTIERVIDAPSGGTSEDMRFSLETVRCIGACGLAPVMTVDEAVHGKLTPAAIAKILERYE